MQFRCVLVADDSRVVCALLEALMSPYAQEVRTAETLAEALDVLETTPHIDLVISDVLFPDGSGLDVVEHLRRSGRETPRVILATARPDDADAAIAEAGGALGYVAKPIRLTDIRRLWTEAEAESGSWPKRDPRVRCGAQVLLRDANSAKEEILACRAHDVSRSGAFLDTGGPLPVGAALSLVLDPDGMAVAVEAVVMRVQNPSWGHVGGAAVRFVDPGPETRAAIERLLTQETPEPS